MSQPELVFLYSLMRLHGMPASVAQAKKRLPKGNWLTLKI
jgi:hypothetical protein